MWCHGGARYNFWQKTKAGNPLSVKKIFLERVRNI